MTEQSTLNQEQIDHDTAIVAGAVLKLAKILLDDTANLNEQLMYNCEADQSADGITVTFTFKPYVGVQ